MKKMIKMIIIGAGSHCRAVISILRDNEWDEPDGILDIGNKRLDKEIMGIPVFDKNDTLENIIIPNITSVLLAIGNNEVRRLWFDKVETLGCKLPNLISKYAIVDSTANLGKAIIACPFSFIGPKAKIENNVLINTSAIVEHESFVGAHSHLASGAIMAGRALLGKCSLLGASATIIDKTKVAENSIIGAGAVVIKDIDESKGTWVGVPVRRVIK